MYLVKENEAPKIKGIEGYINSIKKKADNLIMEPNRHLLSPFVYPGLHNITQRSYIHTMFPTQKDKAIVYCQLICNYLNIDFEIMPTQTRKREIAICRQLCMFFMKKYTILGLKDIGILVGNRDHTTVIYGINTINDLIDSDQKFKATVRELDGFLNEHFKAA